MLLLGTVFSRDYRESVIPAQHYLQQVCVCQRHQRAIPWFTDMFSWVAEHCRGCILFWLKILLIFMIVFKY